MNKLLLIGCGGHAKSIIDLVEENINWEIFGLIGLKHEVGSSILGYEVIGSDSDLKDLKNICPNAFLSIGQIKNAKNRKILAEKLNKFEFFFPTLISPKGYVSNHAILGEGTSIGHGAIINAGSNIGKNCIVNSNSLIEHDCVIEDFCHVSTGAIINGGVKIGSGSFIGSGSIIREGISIPEESVITAGSRIMKI